MEELLQSAYVKRTHKDYSLSLKLQIVKDIEAGRLGITNCKKKYGIQSRSTVVSWLKKYGNFDWENQTSNVMQKTFEKRITEQEAEVKLLEKQKALLEREAYIADKKVIFFTMMSNITESEYQIDIKKNSVAAQPITSAVQKNKLQFLSVDCPVLIDRSIREVRNVALIVQTQLLKQFNWSKNLELSSLILEVRN